MTVSTQKKTLLGILVFLNILFAIFFLSLGYYNRLLQDDYCALGHLKDLGFWETHKYWYLGWSARFSTSFVFSLVTYTQIDAHNQLFFFTFCIYSGLLFSLYQLFKSFNAVRPFQNFIQAWSLVNVFLLNVPELFNFYWVAAAIPYYISIIYILCLLSILLRNNNNKIAYIGLFLFGFLSTTAAEHIGILLGILSLFMLIGVRIIFKSQIILFRKLLFSTIVIIISALFMLLAPGTWARRASEAKNYNLDSDVSMENYILLFWETFSRTLEHTIINPLYALVASLFIAIYWGSLNNSDVSKFLKTKKYILIAIMLFIMVFGILISPQIIVQKILPVIRSLTLIYFFFTILVLIIAFNVGKLFSKYRTLYAFFAVLGVLYFARLSYKKTYLFEDSKAYALHEEQKINHLLELQRQGVKGIVEVEPVLTMENSVYKTNFFFQESDHWVNNCICNGLELDFKISKKMRNTKNEK